MSWEVRVGHALTLLQAMPDESVQTCMTSPPYWGLRNYETDPQVWGGATPGCAHTWQTVHPAGWRKNDDSPGALQGQGNKNRQDLCSWLCDCGAWLGELGMEPTPELFVEHLTTIFREMRRVLKQDGTLWLNIGDSFNGSGGSGGDYGKGGLREGQPKAPGRKVEGLKPKDMVGIPWMLAFALRADGWYLRSDIIWAKERPMPESIRDRPTRSHEYVFLLAKSRYYQYHADAIAEPSVSGHNSGNGFKREHRLSFEGRGNAEQWKAKPTRNARSVWNIPTKPFNGAHFATMPVALAEKAVLAGSLPGDMVLDPFNGAGTTGVAATKHGRNYIGLELNPEYADIARRRLECPLFDLEENSKPQKDIECAMESA